MNKATRAQGNRVRIRKTKKEVRRKKVMKARADGTARLETTVVTKKGTRVDPITQESHEYTREITSTKWKL